MFILIDIETEQRVNFLQLENSKIYRLEILAFPQIQKYKRDKLETDKRGYKKDNETKRKGNRDIESQNKSIFPRMDVTEASSVIPPRLTCPRLTCETKGFKNPWRTLRNVTRLVGEYSLPQHRRRHNLPSKFNLAKSFIPEAEREASNVRYTEDVIDILTKDLGWCTLADIKYGKNIYCPLHENPKTSKTPSAVLYLSTHTFKCFSSRCRISTRISTKQLLNLLVSR